MNTHIHTYLPTYIHKYIYICIYIIYTFRVSNKENEITPHVLVKLAVQTIRLFWDHRKTQAKQLCQTHRL